MLEFSVSVSDLEFGSRLVPSFYYFSQILKNKNRKKGIEYINLERISSEISDGEHSHIPRNSKGGVRYLYGRNIKEGVINFDPVSDDPYIDESDYKAFPRCHIRDRDILITIYGTIGKSAVYHRDYVGTAGIPRHISNIRLSKDAPVTAEFITAYLRSKIGKLHLDSVTTGNIQQLLSLKNIRKFEIPVPEREFIDRITLLDQTALQYETTALALIDKAQRLFRSSLRCDLSSVRKEFSFSVPSASLTEANMWTSNCFNSLYVNTAALLKQHHQVCRLGDIAHIKNGDEAGSDLYKQYVDRDAGDIPFIRTSDIVNYEPDLYPDYYIPPLVYEALGQDTREKDILFTKDGKVGAVGMLTAEDKVILSSGLVRLRVNRAGRAKKITPEYLFLALSIREIGYYAAIRRTVVASTIPHLREERLREIEIPLIDDEAIREITESVRTAFLNKAERKRIYKEIEREMEKYFSISG